MILVPEWGGFNLPVYFIRIHCNLAIGMQRYYPDADVNLKRKD